MSTGHLLAVETLDYRNAKPNKTPRVPCRQHTVVAFSFVIFLIYSVTPCLLTGDLNPFTFKVTMERGGFTIAILFMPSVSLNSFALLLSSFLFYWIFYWHAFTPLFFSFV